MTIIRIFLAGWLVLIVAILLNLVARRIGITTWYDFLSQVSELGVITTVKNLSILSMLFLVLLYPLILGLTAYLTIYLTRNIG